MSGLRSIFSITNRLSSWVSSKILIQARQASWHSICCPVKTAAKEASIYNATSNGPCRGDLLDCYHSEVDNFYFLPSMGFYFSVAQQRLGWSSMSRHEITLTKHSYEYLHEDSFGRDPIELSVADIMDHTSYRQYKKLIKSPLTYFK